MSDCPYCFLADVINSRKSVKNTTVPKLTQRNVYDKILWLNSEFVKLVAMNIFDEVYRINSGRLGKRAMSMTRDNGERFVFTYGELFSEAEKYASALTEAGIRAGDRIAIAAESSPWWIISFFAICKIRCTAALIDASLTGEDLISFIDRSDVRGAFFSRSTYRKAGDKSSLNFPCFDVCDCSLLPDSVKAVPDGTPASADTDEDVACIIFSSGTTRTAAGIMHYHDSLINTTKMTEKVQDISEKSRFLGILPLSHIYGLFSLVMGPLITGADVHFIESLTADNMLGAFREYKPTAFPAVPKVYELFRTAALRKINASPVSKAVFEKIFPLCLRLRRKNGLLLGKTVFKSIHEIFGGSLVRLFSGGAPLNRETAEFYYGLGFNILSTYGASETNVPTLGSVEADISTDTCGKPYPVVDVRISDDGELLIKTPFMMKGYFRDADATREAFTEDGWFRSGDLAEIDEDGNVKITGRAKESIVLSTGKKASPDELEAKYRDIKGLKDFAICGVPAESGDYDEIHAFAVIENGCTEAEIGEKIIKISADLPSFMRIRKTHFVNEIPRTSLQKAKRYKLRQLALDERSGKTAEKVGASVTDGTLAELIGIIARISKVPADSICEDTGVFSDLATDSLSAVDLAMEIESKYSVNVERFYSREMTVRELADIIKAGSTADEKSEAVGIYPQEKTERDYKIFSAFSGFAKFCFNINAINAGNLPTDGGFIICPNHVTKIDYLFVSTALSKERFMRLCAMAKLELFRKDPFSKQLIKSTGMVPVDRGGMNMNTMNSIKAKLREGWCVLIHPEGTRSEDGIFRKIKSGASVIAIDAGVPVIPVYIHGAYELFPKNKKMISFYDVKNKKKYDVDVVFGKPISSSGKTVQELTEELENAILKMQAEYIND